LDGNDRIKLTVGKWNDPEDDPGRDAVLVRAGDGWRLVTP
jgi:hypothetical protein